MSCERSPCEHRRRGCALDPLREERRGFGPRLARRLAAAALGAGLGRAVTTSYLPLLLDEIEDAPGLIGTAMLVNAAAGFVVPLVIGLWSDRRGRRIPFALGGSLLAAGGAAAVALGSGNSYVFLAASGAVVYVGLNAVTTAHRALVPESFPPSGRARATSAQELALLAGGLAGVVAGGALTGLATWAPFAFAAAAMPLPSPCRRRHASASAVAVSPSSVNGARPATTCAPRRGPGSERSWWPRFSGCSATPPFRRSSSSTPRESSGSRPRSPRCGWPALASSPAPRSRPRGGCGTRAGTSRSSSWASPCSEAGSSRSTSPPSLLTVGVGLVAAAAGFGLVSTLGFPLFSALIPAGEAGGYTALYFSARAISSAVALPAAGWAIAASGSYRVLFLLGGAVTLAALAPLARIPAQASASAPTFRIPPLRWWLGSTAGLAGLYAAVVATGHLVTATSLQRLDEAIFRLVNGLGYGPDLLWDALNPHTRNYILLNVLAFAAAAVTRPRRLPHVVALLTLSWLLAWGLLEAVYALYDRPRPSEVLDPSAIVLAKGWTWAQLESFPSGHMAITAALAGAIGLAFPRLRSLLWAYVGAVAFTRVLFGAHFPLDVLAGVALGYTSARVAYAFLATACLLERRPARARERCARPGCAECPQPA